MCEWTFSPQVLNYRLGNLYSCVSDDISPTRKSALGMDYIYIENKPIHPPFFQES